MVPSELVGFTFGRGIQTRAWLVLLPHLDDLPVGYSHPVTHCSLPGHHPHQFLKCHLCVSGAVCFRSGEGTGLRLWPQGKASPGNPASSLGGVMNEGPAILLLLHAGSFPALSWARVPSIKLRLERLFPAGHLAPSKAHSGAQQAGSTVLVDEV